jgi:23S rRNA-/tRNA-specific pseudouridylate synthase
VYGFPITGDNTYGDFKKNKSFQKTYKFITDDFIPSKRMFLHSYSIEFSYILNGLPFTFKAVSTLPVEFQRILDYSNDISGIS